MAFDVAVGHAQAKRCTMVIQTSAVRQYRVRFHDGLAVFETRCPRVGSMVTSMDWGAWTPTYGIPAHALVSTRWELA